MLLTYLTDNDTYCTYRQNSLTHEVEWIMKKNERKSKKIFSAAASRNKTFIADPVKKKRAQKGSFFRYLIENSQSKVTVLDKKGTIIYQNKGFNPIDFYKPEDIVGKNFLELVHPDYVQKVTRFFEDLIRKPGTVKQMQILFRYKDDLWHFLDIRAKGMLDVPEVKGIVVNSRDITDSKHVEDELKKRTDQLENEIEDRKKAEELVLKSEEFFRTIVQNSFDSIVIIDDQGKRKYASSSFKNVGGYDPEDMLGKNVFELVHPDDKAMVFRMFHELLDEPYHTRTLQARYLAKDGNYIWVEVLGVNMLKSPIVQGVVLDTRDITERKRIEEALHKSEERFRAIVQNSTDIIVVVDEKGTNKYISSSFEKITGHKIEERMGRKIMELVHPDDVEKVSKGLSDVLHEPDLIHTIEARYFHGDGTYHWFEISGMNLLNNPNVNGIVTNFRDISERKQSVQMLKEEMEITSQLLSLSEAVATITDVDKLMLEAVKSSKKIMGCDITVSYLLDKQTGLFMPSEVADIPNDILPLFRTETIDMKNIKDFLNIKKPFLIKFSHSIFGDRIAIPFVDLDNEGLKWLSILRYIDIQDINELIVIPLMNRDEFLGMVAGIYMKKDEPATRFTERYYKALIGIANQVSTALEQAKLYRESVEKTMELANRVEVINTMYEIGRSILSNLTSADILNTVTRMAGKLLPCDVAAIMLVDQGKQGFNRVASSGPLAGSLGSFFLFRDTSVTEVIKTGRPQYIPNFSELDNKLPFEQELLENGLMSAIRIPLSIGNENIGVLGFGSKRISAFTHEDLLTAERLGSQISVALANAKLISDLEESSMATIKSLTNAIDAKSRWTAGHSEGVTKHAIAIGKWMGLHEKAINDLEVASMMHDVGKIGTYADILNKKDGLTEEEWALIKQHPVKGAEILSPIKQLKNIIASVEHHHEFFDGSGYPDGLKGNEIPLMARILSVADAVDAMSSDRPYRKGMPAEEIIKELIRCSGSQFDPEVVKAFLAVQDTLK